MQPIRFDFDGLEPIMKPQTTMAKDFAHEKCKDGFANRASGSPALFHVPLFKPFHPKDNTMKFRFLAICFACIMVARTTMAGEALGKSEASSASEREAMIAKAVAYLRDVGQMEDGSFSSKTGPGITGLIAAGLLAVDLPTSDPVVAKSLKYLEGIRREDGGYYAPQSRHANYETCLAIMAFSKANSDGRYTVNHYPEAAIRFAHKPAETLPWGKRVEYPGVMEMISVEEVTALFDRYCRDTGLT